MSSGTVSRNSIYLFALFFQLILGVGFASAQQAVSIINIVDDDCTGDVALALRDITGMDICDDYPIWMPEALRQGRVKLVIVSDFDGDQVQSYGWVLINGVNEREFVKSVKSTPEEFAGFSIIPLQYKNRWSEAKKMNLCFRTEKEVLFANDLDMLKEVIGKDGNFKLPYAERIELLERVEYLEKSGAQMVVVEQIDKIETWDYFSISVDESGVEAEIGMERGGSDNISISDNPRVMMLDSQFVDFAKVSEGESGDIVFKRYSITHVDLRKFRLQLNQAMKRAAEQKQRK